MADFDELLPACSYAGVGPLPVASANTDGGHDAAMHTGYRRRGADVEPCGQQPYSGTLRLALFNDLVGFEGVDVFPGLYYDLLVALEDNPRGTLVHPTKGSMTVLVQKWSETVDPDARNGIYLDLSWVEHNGEAGKLVADEAAPATSESETVARAQVADDAASQVPDKPAFTPTKPVVEDELAGLGAIAVPSLAQIEAAFDAMLAVVESNLALDAFSGAVAHDAVLAWEDLRASLERLRDVYVGDAGGASSYVVPADAALFEIAQAVYGSAARAALLQGANRISDPTLVRAGTVLAVPPVTV